MTREMWEALYNQIGKANPTWHRFEVEECIRHMPNNRSFYYPEGSIEEAASWARHEYRMRVWRHITNTIKKE